MTGYLSQKNHSYQNNSAKAEKKLSFTKGSINKHPLNPFNFEFILNNAAPKILNTSQHRSVQFSYGVNNRPAAHTISAKFLNFTCGPGNSRLSHFRRLILFPFHDFW